MNLLYCRTVQSVSLTLIFKFHSIVMKEITSHNVTKINRNSDRVIVRATVSVAVTVSVSDIDSICDRV